MSLLAVRIKVIARVLLISCVLLLLIGWLAVYVWGAVQLHDKATLSSLILRPVSGATEAYGKETVPGKRSLFVPAADGAKLHCWYFPVARSKQLAIVSHGNAGNICNRLYIVDVLTNAGCSVLLYDYHGYGLSTGRPSIEGILQDGLTIYDYARENLGLSGKDILVFGESIGTAVTLHIATQRDCGGVILQSGIGSIPAVGRNLFPILSVYPDFVFAPPYLNNVALVKQVHVPLLILHGQLDKIVPYRHSEQMYENANEPKRLVLLPACGHNDMGVHDSEQFRSAVKQFVSTKAPAKLRN